MIIGDRDITGEALKAYQQTLQTRLKRREKHGPDNEMNKAIQAVIDRISEELRKDN